MLNTMTTIGLTSALRTSESASAIPTMITVLEGADAIARAA